MLPSLLENAAPDVRPGATVDGDEAGWTLRATQAHLAAAHRATFRAYLERYGEPSGDFGAAETVYGELVNSCTRHAPGPITIAFDWATSTLVVDDAHDRLRSWPFSPDDPRAELTHHAYALISAFAGRIHLRRHPGGGTRASVALPLTKRPTP